MSELINEHGCTECYGTGVGYRTVKNGIKKCDECGGTVLFTQELLDYIAELKSELRVIKGEYD